MLLGDAISLLVFSAAFLADVYEMVQLKSELDGRVMAVLKKFGVPGRTSSGDVKEIIITVDGSAVGTIEKTPGGNFVVQTKGLIPAIDGLTGASEDHIWSKVAEKVRNREVFFTRLITDIQHADRT